MPTIIQKTLSYLYLEFDIPIEQNTQFFEFWRVYPLCKPMWDLWNATKIQMVKKYPKVRIMFAFEPVKHDEILTAWSEAEREYLIKYPPQTPPTAA